MSERILPERANDEIRRLRKQLDALMFGSSKLRSASIGEGGLRLRDGGSIKVEGGDVSLLDGGTLTVEGGDIVIKDAEGVETMRLASDGLTLEGLLEVTGAIALQGLLSVTGDIDVNDGGTITIRDSEGDVQFEAGTDGLTLEGLLLLVGDARFEARDGDDTVRLEWGTIPSSAATGELPLHRLISTDEAGNRRVMVGEFVYPSLDVAHGVWSRRSDGTTSFVADEAQFGAFHDNDEYALYVFDGQVALVRPNGTYAFWADDDLVTLLNADNEVVFRATTSQTQMRRPDGSQSVYFCTNTAATMRGPTTHQGDFEVTGGTKNAAIEAGDGNTYRFGADESPHAGRLIYDFDATVTDGTASVDLPGSLGLIAEGAWVRGPWPQGHPGGDHYAELDGDRLTVHGADGRYMVEVVAYRSDPGTARWEHITPTVNDDEQVSPPEGRPSPRSRGRRERPPNPNARSPNR